MKYKEWLMDWLTNYEKPSTKIRTYEQYEKVVYKRLIPNLGEYELDELTPLIVQKYIAELQQSGNMKTGRGLAANSINPIISVIHKSLSAAHLLGFADTYEMDKLQRPKSEEKPVICFTSDQQKKLEQAVLQDRREKMRGIILDLYTGLRIGELLALEWTDIDFQHGTLTVSKSCHDSTDSEGKYIRITGSPKTTNSRRVIPIPKQLIPMLKAMKKNSRGPYVIMDGDKVPSVRAYQRSFQLLQKKIGIPYHNFHALRHTFATRALECGMDVKSLSEILGHKNANVTLNRYVHSLLEHKKSMMDKLGKRL